MITKVLRRTAKNIALTLAHDYQSRLRLKSGEIILRTTKAIPEALIKSIKDNKDWLIEYLEEDREMWIDQLREHQKYLIANYDDFSLGIGETRFVFVLEDFSVIENLLLDYFDYGFSCIHEDICPNDAIVCCIYCSSSGRWTNG